METITSSPASMRQARPGRAACSWRDTACICAGHLPPAASPEAMPPQDKRVYRTLRERAVLTGAGIRHEQVAEKLMIHRFHRFRRLDFQMGDVRAL